MKNLLENVTLRKHKILIKIKEEMNACGQLIQWWVKDQQFLHFGWYVKGTKMFWKDEKEI